jgi:hypothetical protein
MKVPISLFVRTALTLLLPIILIWVFVEKLCREIVSAFRYAWLEVRENCEVYRDLMRRDVDEGS